MRSILTLFFLSALSFAQTVIVRSPYGPVNPSANVNGTSVTITHNLNTTSVLVSCENSSGAPLAYASTTRTSNAVTVNFSGSVTGTCYVNGTGGVGPQGQPGIGSGSGTYVPDAGGTITINEGVNPPEIKVTDNVFTTLTQAQAAIPTKCVPTSVNGTTYTCGLSPALTSYSNGMTVPFVPDVNSTGSVTLNIDGKGAKKVLKPTGTQAGSGDLTANVPVTLVYSSALDSGSGAFVMQGASVDTSNLVTQATAQVSSLIYCEPASGSGVAYACSLPATVPALTYKAGMMVILKPDVISGTTPTLNINGLGPKNIKRQYQGNLISHELKDTSAYLLIYDGTQFVNVGLSTDEFGAFSVNGNVSAGANLFAQSGEVQAKRFKPVPSNKTCTGGAVTLDQGSTLTNLNLNDQATCSITWATGTGGDAQEATLVMCHGASTATSTITWPANVRGGMAAAGATGTCMVQTFVYNAGKTAWLAKGSGVSGL